MADSAVRRVCSLLGLGLLAAGAAAWLSAPGRGPAHDGGAGAPRPPARFHGARPSQPAPASEAGACRGCHGLEPHRRRLGSRAFLNLHAARMECSICHLASPGAEYRRVPGPSGLVTPGATVGGVWRPKVGPEAGESVRSVGPGCGACHRAGAPLLASGLYDAYRRRMLEELALLYRLGRTLP